MKWSDFRRAFAGRRASVSLGTLGIASFLSLYGVAPITSDSWDIEVDREAVSAKHAYLAEIAESVDAASEDRPNILLIMADDLGKTDISLFGSPYVDTPHIDSIGKQGLTFREAYCTAPICSPSRASLMTGRYHQRFGFETQPQLRYPRNRLEYFAFRYFLDTDNYVVRDFNLVPEPEDMLRQGLPESEITLGELLQAAGYRTGLFGKWHLGRAEDFIPTQRGFDAQYGFYEAFSLFQDIDDPNIVNVRQDHFANRHIWAQKREGPYAIRRDEIPIDEDEYLTFAIARETVAFIEAERDKPFFAFASFSAPHTPFQAPRAYYDRFAHVDNPHRRIYYAMIQALDDAVGEILDALERQGLMDNTLIWFVSDNGGATYTGATENAPLKGGKFFFFEGGLDVPMMMRWDRVLPAGGMRETPVSLMDVFTTSARAAGIELPNDRVIDGVDLLQETSESSRKSLYWKNDYVKVIRRGAWKLMLDDRTGEKRLYNLVTDKEEKHNVTAQHPAVVEALTAELRSWQGELADPLWPGVVDYKVTMDGEAVRVPL